MKELFPGYHRPSPEEISKFWREAIFAPDTNVLLNLYRYSDERERTYLSHSRDWGIASGWTAQVQGPTGQESVQAMDGFVIE